MSWILDLRFQIYHEEAKATAEKKLEEQNQHEAERNYRESLDEKNNVVSPPKEEEGISAAEKQRRWLEEQGLIDKE